MKKIICCLFFVFSTVSLYAQNEPSTVQQFQAILQRAEQSNQEPLLQKQRELTKQEIFHEFGDSAQVAKLKHFSASNTANKPSTSKKWQMAMFLDSENRPTSETLEVLRQEIKNGHLQQASVISFGKFGQNEKKSGKPDGTKGQVKEKKISSSATEGHLYFLYNKQGQAVTEHIAINPAAEIEPLLNQLLQHFKSTPNLYTGMIIDVHGGGAGMGYGKDKVFWTANITDKLTQLKLKVDVLDIQSCHLGSVYSVYPLAKSGMVQYAILSSDVNFGSKYFLNYRLLKNLSAKPREAAVNASRETSKLLRPASTTNSIVLHVPSLGNKLHEWFKIYSEVNNADLKANLSKILPANTWASLNMIVVEQSLYGAQNLRNPQDAYRFAVAGEALYEASQKSLIYQWCYSSKTGETYYNSLADDCLHGISTKKDYMDILIEEAAYD